MYLIRILVTLATLLVASPAFAASAFGDDAKMGEMVAIDPETQAKTQLPNLEVRYEVNIAGDLAQVRVHQKFTNPFEKPTEALYAFPLHEGAAVHAMEMQLPNEIIRAKIKRKKEAQETYEKAKAEGKAAALLEQHRPNMFTQKVANLMPGGSITVTLDYVHPVPRVDGEYLLTLPLVIGERFSPGDMSGNELVKGSGEYNELPAGAGIKGEVSPAVDIKVYVDASAALSNVRSDTHAVEVANVSSKRAVIELAAGKIRTDRHFQLHYALAGKTTHAGIMSAWDEAKKFGHASLLIEPPQTVPDEMAVPREMVFLLDCSGSMGGYPMEASKIFMLHALRNLRPSDTFRVIRFSDSATEFSKKPLRATPANIERGIAYVKGLHGSGGTRMTEGIRQALTVPEPPNTLRLVTFLTDGYIGNDYEVIRQVRGEIGDARLFSIGVGRSPNTYLMDELGRMGRGWTRYIDPTDEVESTSKALAEKLQTPILTDIEIDWGNAPVQEVYPKLIPDVFAGDGLRLNFAFDKTGTYRGKVLARDASGQPVTLPFELALGHESTHAARAMQVTWARARVDHLMQEMLTPEKMRTERGDDAALRERITETGLEYAVVTQWTSFVAVSEKVVNPATTPSGAPLAANVAPRASSTPEPGIIGGLLLMAAAAGASRRRRRRS